MQYKYASISEQLTSSLDVLHDVKGLKIDQASGPKVILNKVLRYLPKCVTIVVTEVFNAFLRRQYYPSAWNHARMVSTLKPENTPRYLLPINSLLDFILLVSSSRSCSVESLEK